jgi:hypothetical protein
MPLSSWHTPQGPATIIARNDPNPYTCMYTIIPRRVTVFFNQLTSKFHISTTIRQKCPKNALIIISEKYPVAIKAFAYRSITVSRVYLQDSLFVNVCVLFL